MRPLTALLLGGLAACADPPPVRPPAPPVELPTAWTGAETSADGSSPGWWRAFRDDRLDAYIEEAAIRSFDVRAAAARVQQAVALARIAGAELAPQLAGRAEALRQKQVFVGLEIPGFDEVLSSETTAYTLSLDLSWEIDLWGRIRSGQSAALADVQASQAELAGVQLSLAGQTAQAYFGAVEALRQRELARQTLASFRATTERIQDRFQRGLRPALDVAFARTAEATAEAALQLREENLAVAMRSLEAIVGRYPRGNAALAEALPELVGPVPGGLPSQLVARRPDLAAAERRLAAAGRRVDEARAALYPRLSITGSVGQTSNELKDLLDGDFSIWRIGGNLLQPIFQGGRLRAAVAAADARQAEALAIYAGQVLQALSEVETALAADRALAAREEALARAVAEARTALDQAERRYLAGLSDILTLQESQRRVFELESQRLSTTRRRLDTRVNLHLALGGGFAWPGE